MPLIQRRIVQGTPIQVGQKEVAPEAQVTSWLQHRAVIGTDHSSGWGAGMVSIQPIALVERGPMGTHRILICDETTRMLVGLAAGAVFVWFLAEVAVRLATNRGGEK
jgi:hypothetical protein